MAPQKVCVGTQNFKFVCTKICGYSKFVGTCTQNLFYEYSKFVGTCTQNLNFVGTQICGYSKFVGAKNLITSILLKISGTKICGYSKKLWVLKFDGIHTQKVIDTKSLWHYHLWVLKICGYTKFVMIQNSR